MNISLEQVISRVTKELKREGVGILAEINVKTALKKKLNVVKEDQAFVSASPNRRSLDGEIGHVDDFIIDDETWTIRYLVVDTRNWLEGKKVLVSPQWIERVSWSESKIHVNLPLDAIKEAPVYTKEFADAGL